MRGMKIGTVKDLEFVPIMGVVVDGKEIVILKTGKKICDREQVHPHGMPAVQLGPSAEGSKVKPSGAPAMDRYSISRPER
jgi:hypothetical protein